MPTFPAFYLPSSHMEKGVKENANVVVTFSCFLLVDECCVVCYKVMQFTQKYL